MSFLELGALVVFDLPRAVVLLGALASEDAGVDDDAADARGNAERGVTDVAGLLTEDGAKELLLGGELRLALRRDLAHEDVAGVDLGADAHDARLVEVLEGLLADVRDVRVISSLPSFVSRATHSNSSMCIEVNTSSFAMRSEMRIESSKL
jgi:hypothetical protein